MPAPRLWNVVAELTYRCPLRCVYCSNPVAYRDVRDGLSAADWRRAFLAAAELGAVHAGLTGGEPCARPDLAEIVAGAAEAGLYPHLVTAGVGAGAPLSEERLAELVAAGLRSVQLSLQDAAPEPGDEIAGAACFEAKLTTAARVRALGLPLVLNVVLHRANLARVPEIVALARRLDAERLELANAQYHGWALLNREALLPTRRQLEDAAAHVAAARRQGPRPEILFVLPDHHADRPKPCMGGWGHRTAVVAPDGLVLPCHGARELPELVFGSLAEHSFADCWRVAPGMNAFRGEAWMRAPCRSCPERARDFGGCRCQAFALAGDPAEADPACALAPAHGRVRAARETAERAGASPPYTHRGALPRDGRESAGGHAPPRLHERVR